MYGYGSSREVPITKRRRYRLDKQAETQRKHRSKLRTLCAPDREDFGRAALAYCLSLYDRNPDNECAASMHRGICGLLVVLGFDPGEVHRRYVAMSERASADVKKWQAKRKFELERMSHAANSGAALPPADNK